MSKSKRGNRRDIGDDGDNAGGIFNMDPNAPYRTHMLFPGRKDDEAPMDPRRSSGSPSFMKTMMGWGKRASDPRASQSQQELQTRFRGTPLGMRGPESEFDVEGPAFRKQVSFRNVANNLLTVAHDNDGVRHFR